MAAWGLAALLVVATSGCALLGREVRAAPPPATTTEPDPKAEFLGDANHLPVKVVGSQAFFLDRPMRIGCPEQDERFTFRP